MCHIAQCLQGKELKDNIIVKSVGEITKSEIYKACSLGFSEKIRYY